MQENTATGRLITAIDKEDAAGVKQALLDGADVNGKWRDSSTPIWLGSILQMDFLWSKGDATRTEERAAYGRIFDMIVPTAKNVASPDKYSSCRGLSSRVFRLNNTEAASLIAIAAIKETHGTVQLNLPEIFSGYGDAKDPYHPAREHMKERLLLTRRRVSARLLNPTTPFEKEVARTLSNTGKEYWLNSLLFPDLADLPMPTEQFLDALDQGGRAAAEAVELMGPYFRGEQMSDGNRLAVRMAWDEAIEARDEIRQLQEEGRLGMRLPESRRPSKTVSPSSEAGSHPLAGTFGAAEKGLNKRLSFGRSRFQERSGREIRRMVARRPRGRSPG